MSKVLHSVSELLTLSSQHLQKKGFSRPRRFAEDLLSLALDCSRMQLYLDFDRPLEEEELNLFRQYLKRFLEREPLSYIKGDLQFYSCRIFTDQRALIPRPETEILVDHMIKVLEKQDLQGKQLWDVACGSGCIALALKKKFPALKVLASDINPAALELAQKNARENGLEIECIKSDLFEAFEGQADFIVSNPPYIKEAEFLELDPSVRDFEPKQALVAGASGLEFYERFAKEMPSFLKSGGKAFFEIGTGQGEALQKIFSGPSWKFARCQKDWAGHDRFFFLEKQA